MSIPRLVLYIEHYIATLLSLLRICLSPNANFDSCLINPFFFSCGTTLFGYCPLQQPVELGYFNPLLIIHMSIWEGSVWADVLTCAARYQLMA